MPNNVSKSINDERDYRVVTLPNGLVCLLIHDKEADKSSASLSVKIGFHQDPEAFPGLAHFLEHMLFLGTEKYPDQDEYANYISANSGARNAFTSAYETNYYFDCSNSALNGALDRFSKFFVCPLFTESCTQREINAVNSEHEKNIMQDLWRQMQLFRSTAKEGHVYNRFGTGSKTTLDKPEIRQNLLDFHKKYYSANLMKAVIYGIESLDTLEEWAKEYFGSVNNQQTEAPKVSEIPFSEENLGNLWKIFPVRDQDLIEFVWVMEDFEPQYKNNPAKYVSHLLGHEGPNSLFSYLMDEGLATGLTASYMPERNIFGVISVEVELTKKGLENYKQVCSLVFGYIKMLQEKGPQEWIFEELKKTYKFQFDYKDKEKPISYTSSLAAKMHFYPIEDVLQVGYMMEEYKPELISRAIDSLAIDNVRIYLISKSVEKQCDQVEKIYGTKYSCEKIDAGLRKLLEKPEIKPSKSGKILDLPPPNHFIPENFDVFATNFESLPNYPEKIYESHITETYFKQDNKFKKPKATVIIKLYCNDLGFGYDLQTFSLWGYWLKLFREALRELLYQAETAKLHVSVERDHHLNGMKFFITGFNDSIDKICIDLFEKFKNFDPSPMKEEFLNFKKRGLEEIRNLNTKPPYLQALNLVGVFLNSETGTTALPEVLYEKLDELTFEDILRFHKDFFHTIRLESLFMGNLTKDKALETTRHIENILSTIRPNTKILAKELIPEIRVINLETNKGWFFERLIPSVETGEKESNSCLINYYQFEKQTIETELLVGILSNYIKSPCFNTLRTDEQLGYIVHSANYNYRDILGFIMLIQSNVKSSHYVSQRVSAFLDKTREKIKDITEEEFQKYVESVRVTLAQKDLSIIEEASRYWNEIGTHRYVFNRREIELQKISTLKREELIEIFDKLFYTKRKLLELHIVSQNHLEENDQMRAERVKNEPTLTSIFAPEDLRRRLPLYADSYLPNSNKK